MGRGHPYRALNPVDDLPYRGAASGDLVYILEPVDRPLLSLLQQVYPAGLAEEQRDPFGQELFLSYTVPQADLAASQGVVGQYFSSYPPTQAPEASQAVAALDLDMAQAPLAAPYFALFEGTILAPRYGEYTFALDAQGEAASLQIGREQRLDLPEGGQGQLTATLAEGFHPFRLEYHSGAQPGKLKSDVVRTRFRRRDRGRCAAVQLSVRRPGVGRQLLPQRQLGRTAGAGAQ